ncbi:MAG: hypothetical protein RLZZ519_1780 [Bacteroidota bacterium]|jgi:hypothetical protein
MFPLRSALILLLVAVLAVPISALAKDSTVTCIPNRLPAPLCYQVPGGSGNEQVVFFGRTFHSKFFVLNQSDSSLVTVTFEPAMVRGMNSDKKAELSFQINGKVGNSHTISPMTNALFELNAAIPDTGSWFADLRGNVTIPMKGKEAKVIPFAFQLVFRAHAQKNVARAKPFFLVENISTVNAYYSSPKIRIVVRDTSNKGGEMNLPQIILRKKIGDTGKAQANYQKIIFQDETGDTIDALKFENGEERILIATVDGLCQAGSYEGEAIFTAIGQTEIKQTFTLNKRSNVLWAILLIALGTFGGYIGMKLIGSLKPKLLLTRNAVLLDQKMDLTKQQFEPLLEGELPLHTFLKVELEELILRLKFGIPSDIEAELKVLRAKIEVYLEWITIHRQVEALKLDDPNTEMTNPLNEVKEWIRNSKSKPEEKAQQFTILASVKALVDEAKKSALKFSREGGATLLPPTPKAKPIPTLPEIDEKIRNAEIYSTLIIMTLSVLIGLLTLYYPNDSWGSASDKILLVLWGFGLHTVTKNTDFSGGIFGYITGKLSPSTTPPTESGTT